MKAAIEVVSQEGGLTRQYEEGPLTHPSVGSPPSQATASLQRLVTANTYLYSMPSILLDKYALYKELGELFRPEEFQKV